MTYKFLLALAIGSFAYSFSHAQISKGSLWLGGNVNYYKNKDKFLNGTNAAMERNLSINPAIGQAIKDNTIVGADLSFSSFKSLTQSYYNGGSQDLVTKTHSYGAGVFIRQYVPIVSRLYLFGQARAYYLGSKSKTTYAGYASGDSKTNSFGISVYPGLSVAINKKLHIESGLSNLFNVGYTRTKSNGSQTTNNVAASLNTDAKTDFYVGFRLLINNKS